MTFDSHDSAPDVLIYGAYGYSGRLVVAEAVRCGVRPTLAGRDHRRLEALADEHGLPWVAVSLDDPTALDRALADYAVVAHCAGPPLRTAIPMVEPCLRTGTHYLDLTREAEVFASVYAHHEQAMAADIALIPGAGFDVVPADHLVATMADRLPDAVSADIAVISNGGFSSGTLTTALHDVTLGNRVVRNGRSKSVASATGRSTSICPPARCGSQAHPSVIWHPRRAIPGLRHVTTFSVVPGAPLVHMMDAPLRSTLRRKAVSTAVAKVVGRLPGPSAKAMRGTRTAGWARLYDAGGTSVSAAVEVSNTYAFTAASMIHAAASYDGVERQGR